MTLGIFKKETSQVILEVVRYLKDSGYVIERPSRGVQTTVPPDAPIYIRNDSDEEIPAFGCVQTTGTVDFGGQNYITVDKPSDTSGTAGKYLFNSIAPVAVDDYGIAYAGPLIRVLTDGSTVTCGAQWQPVVDSFALAPGGSLFTAAGLDDIKDDVMRAFVNSGGGGGSFVEEVRWVDPVLEYRIGSTWYTIDTAENCNTVSPFISGLGI